MPNASDLTQSPNTVVNGAERRRLLRAAGGGALVGSGLASGVTMADSIARAPMSWQQTGGGFSNYGVPADDAGLIRWVTTEPSAPGNGASWTPLHELAGAVTPNGLHFERHHNGVPLLTTDTWSLSIEGLVSHPMTFSLAMLRRRPQRSRIAFLECGGNSNALWRESPTQTSIGWLHGLVSSGEWSGVPLKALLEETAPRRSGRWLIASGFDASGVTVSLPLDRLPDDSLIALHRNGEALRPEHGWPARLLIPGYEGIVNIKWLGRLELSDRPAMSRFDTVAYTDLGKDGIARRFTRVMGVKSVITSPDIGASVAIGPVEISGLAWSGAGSIQRVEVSVDGGRNWSDAALNGPVLDRAFVRFSLLWERRAGKAGILQSRAYDDAGRVQPTREALMALHGANSYHHFNGIVSTAIDADGHTNHVYA